MYSQQMIEFLLAMQAKADADRKADQENLIAKLNADTKTDKEEMRANQEKVEADRKTDKTDLMAKLDANRKTDKVGRKADKEELKAAIQSMPSELDESLQRKIEAIKAKTIACQQVEARLEEEMLTTVHTK